MIVVSNRQFPKHPGSADHRQRPVIPELYGTINTLKQGFGFIQPILEEEQIYFGGRELTGEMRVGDRIGFITRESARGLAAENVRLLDPNSETVVAHIKGTISRSPDRHRSNFGLITLDKAANDSHSVSLLEAASVKEIAFLPIDVVANSVPKNHRLDKGDYVEFDIHRVVGSNLFIAKSLSLLQLKRDRARTEQIQRMLDAGVPREQGVISTVKKGEYGFIRPLDRKEEIYFRLVDCRGKEADGSGDADGLERLAEVHFSHFFRSN